jgi:DNA-binding MarR family transcriptional regulator
MPPSRPDPARAKTQPSAAQPAPERARWTFLTNHAHVLILLSRDPSLVLREVAATVGITERAVQRIIADLEEDGFLERERIGRKNHYRILVKRPLRHPIEAHRTIGDLISMIVDAR